MFLFTNVLLNNLGKGNINLKRISTHTKNFAGIVQFCETNFNKKESKLKFEGQQNFWCYYEYFRSKMMVKSIHCYIIDANRRFIERKQDKWFLIPAFDK